MEAKTHSLPSNPLFSTFVTLYTLIFLYFPHFFFSLLFLSPILLPTFFLLLSLLRRGSAQSNPTQLKLYPGNPVFELGSVPDQYGSDQTELNQTRSVESDGSTQFGPEPVNRALEYIEEVLGTESYSGANDSIGVGYEELSDPGNPVFKPGSVPDWYHSEQTEPNQTGFLLPDDSIPLQPEPQNLEPPHQAQLLKADDSIRLGSEAGSDPGNLVFERVSVSDRCHRTRFGPEPVNRVSEHIKAELGAESCSSADDSITVRSEPGSEPGNPDLLKENEENSSAGFGSDPSRVFCGVLIGWDVGGPLEVIYEECNEGEDQLDGVVLVGGLRETCHVEIQRYPSLSWYYPETDSDNSSSEGEFPTAKTSESSVESVVFRWDDDEEEREGLIEIDISSAKGQVNEENLIEIDISPARFNNFPARKLGVLGEC